MDAAHNNTRQVVESKGGSMFPFVPGGSLLTVESARQTRFAAGDIICFIGEGKQLVAHRVIEVADGMLRVRGDRGGCDELVPASAVFGRVLHVRRGLLDYATDDAVGRLLAHVALKRPRLHHAMIRAAEQLVRLRTWSRR